MNLHLSEILKETSTVIIPDLGALTLTNVETGETMFMSYLKYDDGKLTQFISEKEGISMEESKEKITLEVKKINDVLNKKEKYTIPQIGQFSKDSSDEIIFEPVTQVDSGEKKSIDTEDVNTDQAIDSSEPEIISIPPITEEPTVIAASVPVEEDSLKEKINEPEIPIDSVPPVIEKNKKQEIEYVEEETTNTEYVPEPEVEKEVKKKGRKKTETPIITGDQKDVESASPIVSDKDVNEEIIEPELSRENNSINSYTEEDQWKDDLDVPPINAKIERPKKPILEKTKKDKKPRRPGFYIILTLLILIIGGTLTVAMFYNSLEKVLPFLNSEKIHEKEADEEIAKEGEKSEIVNSDKIVADKINDDQNQQESTPEVPKTEEKAVETSNESNVIQTSTGQIDRNKPFHIIAGAFTEKSNADRYQNSLISDGNPSVIIGRFDQLYIVSIGSYTTMEEAKNSIESAKNKSPKAWIFQWP